MTRRLWILALGGIAMAWGGFEAGRRHLPAPVPGPPVIGIASIGGDAYVRAVRAAGGVPVILPNTDASPEAIDRYLVILDALLLPGGADIPPSEYGETPHPTVEILDDRRLEFEKRLGQAWIGRTRKPLLGICLGSQWINVLHGGSLIQDIPSETGANHRGTRHPVAIEPGSRLAGIFGESGFEVNSWHHQAVRALGRGLRISARSPDGTVEATETTDPSRFLIGVQWHPEKMLPDDPRQAKLLRAFVEAAARHKSAP